MLVDNDDVFHLVSQYLSVPALVTLGTTCKTMEKRVRGLVQTRLETWKRELEEESQNQDPFELREETEEEWQKASQNFMRERTSLAFRKLECEVVATAFQMNYRLDGSWTHFFGVAKNAGEIWITGLHFAAATNDVDLCRLLINLGAEVNDNVTIELEMLLDPNEKYSVIKEENSSSSWYQEADEYFGYPGEDDDDEASFDYYSDCEYDADEESDDNSRSTKTYGHKKHKSSDPYAFEDASTGLRGCEDNVHPMADPVSNQPHHCHSSVIGPANNDKYNPLDADDLIDPDISWGYITPLRLAKIFGCQEACTFLESQGGKLFETHDISEELWMDNGTALHNFASPDATKACWTCSEYTQILYKNDLVYPGAGPGLVLFEANMFKSFVRHLPLPNVRCPKTGALPDCYSCDRQELIQCNM